MFLMQLVTLGTTGTCPLMIMNIIEHTNNIPGYHSLAALYKLHSI